MTQSWTMASIGGCPSSPQLVHTTSSRPNESMDVPHWALPQRRQFIVSHLSCVAFVFS